MPKQLKKSLRRGIFSGLRVLSVNAFLPGVSG
jgi:hypothetical protein